jgi:hypothetical protein
MDHNTAGNKNKKTHSKKGERFIKFSLAPLKSKSFNMHQNNSCAQVVPDLGNVMR